MVIGTAVFLPYFGEHIASETGLGNSFFGTLFIAAATSLPELVVSLAALRMGSTDMAVGNLLGSNIFNMFILGIDDIFTGKVLYSKHSTFPFVIRICHHYHDSSSCIRSSFKPKKKQVWF
ncbi:MAG: hypothetical protein IPN56_16635 [Chitinophagaceae bacterium]|nr:hypothetical protein [Chitinophagaceae bacterium]